MSLSSQELSYKARQFDQIVGTIGLFLKMGTVCFLGYWFFETLRVLGAMHPASLDALSNVIEKIKFGDWLHGILTVTVGSAWALERQGKKRAIRKLAECRNAVEAKDKHKGSSQLDKNGDTPKKLKGK